jgi:hypothetical protein
VNILQAIADPKVFAGHFRGSSWNAWRVFLATLFALPMTADEVELYRKHTGRTAPPTVPSHEAWLCIGRRGGKSFILAVIAVFLACFRDWRPYLGPGEAGTIMVVCADRKQARTIMRFALGLLKAVPMLKRQVENVTREVIELKHNIVIEVHTASFRSTRGYSIVAALCDEIAYWPTDEASAQPDAEVINAIKPAMATVPGAMLLCASSPHAKCGALWDAHRKHFGQDDDSVLVWQASTRDMNPGVPQSYIDQHMADDPARAAAEYLAEFRADLETFLDDALIERAVEYGRPAELPPRENIVYHCFTDMSGGGREASTLCICHRDGERIIANVIRGRRGPHDPAKVAAEFAALAKQYRCRIMTGDNYAKEWVAGAYRSAGLEYRRSPLVKSDLYLEGQVLFARGLVNIPPDAILLRELRLLERRVARSGKDSVDHGVGGSDDHANALFGAMYVAVKAQAVTEPPIVVPFVASRSALGLPVHCPPGGFTPRASWSRV